VKLVRGGIVEGGRGSPVSDFSGKAWPVGFLPVRSRLMVIGGGGA